MKGASAQETTLDSIQRGRLLLEQPRRGYRFNVDAILLAAFAGSPGAAGAQPAHVVDLGAGCGIVGLLLARQWDMVRVTLVERQASLAALAERNVSHNGFAERVQVRCEDLRELGWSGHAGGPTLAVCNPPFFCPQRGRTSPDPMIAQARHELAGSLTELVAAMGAGLARGDTLALIHDVRRQLELEELLPEHGLEIDVLRYVHPLPGEPARRVLLRATRGPVAASAGVVELPPLVLHEAPGRPTTELASILGDGQ